MKKLLFISLAVLFAGCATTSSMGKAPSDGGLVEVYEAPVDTVYDASLSALKLLGMEIESEDRTQKIIVASVGASITDGGSFSIIAWSYGAKIGVYLNSLPDGRTEARIKTRDVNFFALAPAERSYEVQMMIYAQLIKMREEQGHFDEGIPFLNTLESQVEPIKPESVAALGKTLEKYNLRGMGLTRRARMQLVRVLVLGEQSRFSYTEDSEVDWYLDTNSPGRIFNPIKVKKNAAHPGIYVEWTGPDGTLVKSESVKKSNDVMVSRLDLKSLPESAALGLWKVKVTLNDEPFDERQFEVIRSYRV